MNKRDKLKFFIQAASDWFRAVSALVDEIFPPGQFYRNSWNFDEQTGAVTVTRCGPYHFMRDVVGCFKPLPRPAYPE